MITLYQFKRSWGIPNPGQFCVKLETYLRMAGIEYRIEETLPMLAPLMKLPYLVDDGYKIADSRFIIKYLKLHYGDSLDQALTATEKSVALAMQRLLEEHLYWVSMYSRWQYTDENWQLNKQAIFKGVPGFLVEIAALAYSVRIRGQIRGQGLSRLSVDQIFELGREDIDALSRFLAGKPYLMGNNPTTVDASAYGILINIVASPIQSPLKEYALTKANLVDYCRRVHQRYFPELAPVHLTTA